MQSDVERVLRNLGVVGQLKQNDKLFTQADYFTIYSPTSWRELFRVIYRENRDQNLDRIAECVRSAKAFVTSVLAESVHEHVGVPTSIVTRLHQNGQTQLCGRVVSRLSETIVGLDHLSETYKADAATLCRIENIKADITEFLRTTQIVERDASPRPFLQ